MARDLMPEDGKDRMPELPEDEKESFHTDMPVPIQADGKTFIFQTLYPTKISTYISGYKCIFELQMLKC